MIVTEPEKPFKLVNVITVELGDPGYILRLVWPAEIVKSTTLTETVVVTVNEGEVELAPVIVTSAFPGLKAVTLRVADALPPTLSVTCKGLIEARRQPHPLTWAVKLTVPAYPRLVSVTADCADVPAGIFSVEGLDVTLKPTITARTLAFPVTVVLRAVTVML